MSNSGPLDGIRVLDFSHILSAPYGTMLVADLGAEVVRVERPGGGDALRKSPPHQEGESGYYFCANRNKKSIIVDIKTEEGVALIKRLVKDFDVFVENFRPGVMDRLGLGYEAIKAIRPDIVYASLSAFGDVGPYRNKPGFELIIQSLAGVVDVTSEPDRPPAKVQLQIVDLGGGVFLSLSILGALYHRLKTGEGQHVKTSLLESIVALSTNLIGIHLMGGKVPTLMRSRNPQLFPSQAFQTKDGYISVVCPADHWPRFCRALGREDWIDHPDYSDINYRMKHYEEMEERVTSITRLRTTAEWLERFEAEQVAAGPINTVEELFEDPQFKALNMVESIRHTTAGMVDVLRPPFTFSKTPAEVRQAPPAYGEHTEEILAEAGFSQEDIARLDETGVIQRLKRKMG